MSIYGDWMNIARAPQTQEQQNQFWSAYFAIERDGYEKILSRPDEPYTGTLAELAAEFGMEKEVFCGFIDGINTSLKAGQYDLESLTEESPISLEVDMETLYYNMLDAKATWLYELPMWDNILSEECRKELTKKYRAANVFVAEKKPGRNDPCPCGSGKKYKNCCGKNA